MKMTRVGRLVLLFGTVGLFGMGAYITVVLSTERNNSCTYTYIYADDAELARRLIARARVVMARGDQQPAVVSIYDDDEWWRRAKFLPKAGVVDCGTFRATIEYAVDTEQEQVTVEGNEEAYRKWREEMRKRKDTANPFWVDLRKWEKRR
jgi:hypothetical protein